MDKATLPFEPVKDHVMLPFASKLNEAQKIFTNKLNPEIIRNIVQSVPDEWLLYDAPFQTTTDNRNAYSEYLIKRLENSQTLTQHAIHVRESVI